MQTKIITENFPDVKVQGLDFAVSTVTVDERIRDMWAGQHALKHGVPDGIKPMIEKDEENHIWKYRWTWFEITLLETN